MKVTELTPDQLDELRQQYNYDVNDSTAIVDETDIPDSVLFAYFGDVDFTDDDFSSRAQDQQIYNWALNEFGSTLDAGELEDIMTLMQL